MPVTKLTRPAARLQEAANHRPNYLIFLPFPEKAGKDGHPAVACCIAGLRALRHPSCAGVVGTNPAFDGIPPPNLPGVGCD